MDRVQPGGGHIRLYETYILPPLHGGIPPGGDAGRLETGQPQATPPIRAVAGGCLAWGRAVMSVETGGNGLPNPRLRIRNHHADTQVSGAASAATVTMRSANPSCHISTASHA